MGGRGSEEYLKDYGQFYVADVIIEKFIQSRAHEIQKVCDWDTLDFSNTEPMYRPDPKFYATMQYVDKDPKLKELLRVRI